MREINLFTEPANRDPLTPREELAKTGVAGAIGLGAAYVLSDKVPVPPEVTAVVFTVVLKALGNFGRSLAAEAKETGHKVLGTIFGWFG